MIKSDWRSGTNIRRWRGYIPALLISGLLVGGSESAAAAIELTEVAGGSNGGGFYVSGEPTLGSGLPGDLLGANTMGLGDVNGDGFADFMALAWIYGYTAPGAGSDGFKPAVAVVFGKDDNSHIELTDIAQGDGGFLITGIRYQQDLASIAGAAGDFNGDGLDDIVVGGGVAANNSSPGRVTVVFGRTSGGTVDLSTATSGVFTISIGAGASQLGKSVSGAGDVNGDGLGDIIAVGRVPFFDDPDNSHRAFVFFGRNASGTTTAAGALSSGGFSIKDSDSNYLIPDSVTGAGDVNGDGLDDLLVRRTRSSSPAGTFNQCAIVFGKASNTTVDLVDVAAGLGGGFVIVDTHSDSLGRCLATAGDVNGDGLSDFCLSTPTVSIAGPPLVQDLWYVVHGKADSFPIESSSIDAGIGGFVIKNDSPSNYRFPFGRGLGDINQDGLGDVGVGGFLYFDDIVPGSLSVVHGKPDGQSVLYSQIQNDVGGVAVKSASPLEWIGWSTGSAGDVDGNGTTDFMVGGPRSYGGRGAAFVLFTEPSGLPTSQYTTHCKSGIAPLRGVGVLGDGTQYPPDSNAWIGFDSGSGPGVDGSSEVTVEIHRTDAAISNLGNGSLLDVPDVVWRVVSDRTAWANATVSIRVTDGQLAGLDVEDVILHQAADPAGPWTPLATTVNATKHIVTATTGALGYFALAADLAPLTVSITPETTNSEKDYASWRLVFSDDVAPSFGINDIATSSTLATEFMLLGSDPVYRLYGLFDDPEAEGAVEWELDGTVVGRFGNVLAVPSPAQSHTIENYDDADINKDGLVDLLDVSLLADYNLGIATLP